MGLEREVLRASLACNMPTIMKFEHFDFQQVKRIIVENHHPAQESQAIALIAIADTGRFFVSGALSLISTLFSISLRCILFWLLPLVLILAHSSSKRQLTTQL